MSRDGKALFRNRELMLFLGVVLFACLPSMAYNNYGNVYLNEKHYWHPAALMTVGQVSEVLMLAASPWLIPRLGLNKLFAAGIAAWSVRYLLLALASYTSMTWPVYAAIAIHGICYVFVYIVGVIYVDRLVSHSHRGLAQGMYTIVYAGLANLLGGISVGYCESLFLNPKGIDDWTIFWLIPAAISASTAVTFVAISWRRSVRTALSPP
jgi:MFS family permease